MKRSLKLTIGLAIPIVVLLVLLYFFLWAPITITVSAIFPPDAQGNPAITAISSLEEVTVSKNAPSIKLKVKRSGSVEFMTLEGVLLDRKEIARGVKELRYAFPEPGIDAFDYSFSEDGKNLILSWKAESSPYNVDNISLKRNGTTVTRKGDSYSDNIVDFQGKTVSYDLTIGYNYGPVYVEKSKTLNIEIPLLPVEVQIKVLLGKGLVAEKASLLLDERLYKLESNLKAVISAVPQGKHKLELQYDGISVLTKEIILKWNNDIPYLLEFPIDSIEISKLSTTRDGENVVLNWESVLKSYEETDVSYLITAEGLNVTTTEKSFVLPLPEENMQIIVTPLYKGVAFGPEETVEIFGKPFFDLRAIPGYIPTNSLEIAFEARNISELLLSLDGDAPVIVDPQKGEVVFEELSEGAHVINFYITDLYGENFIKSATFVVDTTPPNEPTLLDYRIDGKRIIINLATSSDTISVFGEVNVSETSTYPIETKNNIITIPVPSPETGFNGNLELFLTAIDRVGNMSMKARYEIDLVNFDKFAESLDFDVVNKDYKPVTLRISNSRISEEASITVIVETLKGTKSFVYDLSNAFSVSEPLEGVYFGEIKISYVINALGVESPTYIATETRVDLKNLEGFYTYQVDEDGKFRVRFYPVPDPEVKYRIRRKILDTPVNQEEKTVLPGEVDLDNDLPIVIDFDSPLSFTSNATTEVSVEVEMVTDHYSYMFPEKRLTLYKGATILTGNAKSVEFDERAFPILIAENYSIPGDTEVSIEGKGLILIQDGSSFVINGKLDVSGTNGQIILKDESRNGIMLYGGELNLKNASGYGMSFFASGARLNVEDCVFSDVFNPLIAKNGSSVKLNSVYINSVGTAGYISDAVAFEANNVEISNSTKGFILINAQKAYLSRYVATKGIKNTGLEIKNSLSDEIFIEELDISSWRFALIIENLKRLVLKNARLKSSGFYVMALSNVEDAQLSDVSISGFLEKGQPNIGLFVASAGGVFNGISVSYCKETGIFINNRLLPEKLISTYNALSSEKKKNWAPITLNTKTRAFSENFYDIYLEGIYNLYVSGVDLNKLRIYDGKVDNTWSNELGKIFPRGIVIAK